MIATIEGLNILGIAATVPRNQLSMASLGEKFGDDYVRRVTESTGIHSVRIAEPDVRASDLCFDAAKRLFEALRADRASVDAIVFVSQTPDHVMPATSAVLQKRLELSENTLAFDINYGCSGYVYGLLQASVLISSRLCQRVLVLAGDVISPYLAEGDSHVRMVLGDAGSATLVDRGSGSIAFSMHTDGGGSKSLIIASPTSHLQMDGTAIMNFALKAAPQAIQEVMRAREWTTEDVGTFAFHQANQFIVQYLARKMRVPVAASPISVSDVGNTGPASIPLLLSREGARLQSENRMNRVVLCGFGVGLSWGAAALSLANTLFLPMAEI